MAVTAVITGATDGIGLELAKIHLCLGHTVYAVGRRKLAETPLARLPQENIHYLRVDLSETDSSRQLADKLVGMLAAGKTAAGANESIDYLYLNAAGGYFGDYALQSPESIANLSEVNFLSPLFTLCELRSLLNKSSVIKVIGSIAHRLVREDFVVYCALKAALAMAIHSIQEESNSFGEIIMVEPGAIATSIHVKSGMSLEQAAAVVGHSPRSVAWKIYRCRARRRRRVIGGINRIFFSLSQAGELASLLRPAGKLKIASPHSSKNIFIIGAAEGIGRAIAQQYLGGGRGECTLYLYDNNLELLRKNFADSTGTAAGVGVRLAYCDVEKTEHAVKQLAADAQQADGIDLLYIPAGISAVANYENIDPAVYRRVYQCNTHVVLQLVRKLLGDALMRRGGSITLFSSLSHYFTYPGAAFYAATKTALAALSKGLYKKLLSSNGVVIRAVYPGPTDTRHAKRYSPDNARSGTQRTSPEVVAKAVVGAQATTSRHIFATSAQRLLAAAAILFPRLFAGIMRKAVYAKISQTLLPPQDSGDNPKK